MKIGKYTLRKPWTYEVEIDLGAELYAAVRKSIGEDIAREIEAIDYEIAAGNDHIENIALMASRGAQYQCARIARGQK